MQVQDFTVIRISPIVYNDRDILEIGVIFTQPPNWARKHTHKTLRQRQVMHVLADALVHKRKRRPHSEQRESVGTHRMMSCSMATWKYGYGLQHRFAVCSSSQSALLCICPPHLFAQSVRTICLLCAHRAKVEFMSTTMRLQWWIISHWESSWLLSETFACRGDKDANPGLLATARNKHGQQIRS